MDDGTACGRVKNNMGLLCEERKSFRGLQASWCACGLAMSNV